MCTQVVGRDREVRLLLAALTAGRDVLLEGPPGTGKSTLLREITGALGVPMVFVEGNAELTTSRIVGHHSPARTLREDFSADTFVPGPLVEAMQRGGFLYVEEINRAPEDTLNALLTAIAEREIHVPRVGRVTAAPGFRLIASMNPFDNVGTSRISTSVHDRLCRVAVGYQSREDELEIVRRRAFGNGASDTSGRLLDDAVSLTRATRLHPEIRHGSSVRGAIDLALIAAQLEVLSEPDVVSALATADDGPAAWADLVWDAMVVALSGRIHVDETSDLTSESVLRILWEDHFVLGPRRAKPG